MMLSPINHLLSTSIKEQVILLFMLDNEDRIHLFISLKVIWLKTLYLSPTAVMLKSQGGFLLPLPSAQGKVDPELKTWLSP